MHGSMHRSIHGSMHRSIHGSMHGSIHGFMHGCINYFFVSKGIHYTPTGDNPHAACPSRPRWGVTPYIGRSSPGQLPGVSHLIIFWPPLRITVRTGFGGQNEVPNASQMTSKIDQMKDWSRKPFSEDKKYHSLISSDFQRELSPLQNHAKTICFFKDLFGFTWFARCKVCIPN